MSQSYRHSENVPLSKLHFFLFFIHKDISVVFLFVLKLHRTGKHSYFPSHSGVFWLVVSGWVPRNAGCVGALMGSWCQRAEIGQLGYNLPRIHRQQSPQGGRADLRETPGPYLGDSEHTKGDLYWLPWSGHANKNVPSLGWASNSQHCSSSTRALCSSAASCFPLLLLDSFLSYLVKQSGTACLAFGELPEVHRTRRKPGSPSTLLCPLLVRTQSPREP